MNTQEEHDAFLRLALSCYVGEKCQGCGNAFASIEEIKNTNAVWWPHDGGRIGHKKCFDARTNKNP
jgi:hypothetical protein